MKKPITPVLQKSISSIFPDKRVQTLAGIFVLFLVGMMAMLLHAKLRVPLHLPGKQGLLFMFLIVSSSLMSGFRFSTLIATTGSAALLLTGFGGFSDPFMPVYYVVLGVMMDLLLDSSSLSSGKAWSIGLAGALSFSVIPLSRALIAFLTGLPFPSLFNGVAYPWLTHLLFGFLGSYVAALAVKSAVSEK
ncbi:MAG: hypothetical protein M9948_08360 [Lentimicrobium sp.]|nr:hypothetical protein [Lentimicrobium sp.]